MSVDWTASDATVGAALRARGVESDLTDAVLKSHATAAVQEIAARGLGPRADVEWISFGGGSLITLDPPAASIADIEEEGIELTDGTDYRLRPGGIFLERITDTYPSYWRGRITGTTTLAVADERYDRVVVDLVKLALEYSGVDSRRDGDYAEDSKGARGGGGQHNYQLERDLLISELAPAGIGFA